MTTRGGPVGDGYHHRSAFKRSNKPFKGRSKGRAERDHRGKVDPKGSQPSLPPQPSLPSTSAKLVRIHRSRQLQQQRRADLVQQKRIGSQRGPPRIIALIPLNPSINLSSLTIALTSGATRHLSDSAGVHQVEWNSGGRAKRVVLYETPRDQHAILDAAKVADVVVFVASPHPPSAAEEGAKGGGVGEDEGVGESPLSSDASPHLFVDDFGRHALTLIKAQGLPSSIGLLQASPSSMGSKAAGLYRKTATRFFHTAIGDDCRVVGMDSGADSVRRWLVEGRLKPLGWREERSYLLGVSTAYEAERRTLRVRGWLRGDRGLDVNGLVHITGHGDYLLEKIQGTQERRPEPRGKAAGSRRSSRVDGMEVEAEGEAVTTDQEVSGGGGLVVLAASTEEARQSLVSLNPVDPLAHEQSLITDEELAGADDDDAMSDHDPAHPSDDDNSSAPQPAPREKRRHQPGEAGHQRAWDEALGWEDEDGAAVASVSADATAEVAVAEKVKLERDEVEFPDEVSVPPGTVYRERFARYRGLKSLRDSEWDVKEGLPLPYSQIFTFADFKHSRAVARREGQGKTEADGWVAGERSSEVTLSVSDVDERVAAALLKGAGPVVLFGLMAHEHKVSVTHCALMRQAEWSAPIRGKEAMEVHCAFRRFTVQPIYSQQSSRPRALVERFFHPGRCVTASFYSRILYPPAPLLMFRPSAPSPAPSTVNPIVATGSLTSVDPDRLLLKRVVLTGAPLSCRGREAVVHRMFETPQDVEWFKPVELWTKRGLVGHVKGSHGLHGRMECEFDGFIQQSDTVCMSLYKRQFCPFDAAHFGSH